MLAIASPYFRAPLATFIRNHMHNLALGQTIMLCEDGSGTEQFRRRVDLSVALLQR
jgi:hypothetical protein